MKYRITQFEDGTAQLQLREGGEVTAQYKMQSLSDAEKLMRRDVQSRKVTRIRNYNELGQPEDVE